MAETVNLKKSYAKVNEALIKLFDESGVRRSFTVPYIQGQEMSDHISAIGQAASQNGGLTGNLVTSAHHSGGKGWGSGDGHTVGHPAEKLRQTIIPAKDENAKAAIDAAQKHISNLKFLLGDDDPAVQTAQGQLDLVKKTDGKGMNLQDFGVLLIQMMTKPTQEVAKAHDQTKRGGMHPNLRGPAKPVAQQGQESPQEPQGEAQPAAGESEAQAAPEPQGAPPAVPAGAPAPVTSQPQG